MGVYALIDDFRGDPEDLYNLVVEEINRRELPDLKFDWVEEVEWNRLIFSKGAKTRALRVCFRGHYITVLAYQIGRSFHVSARTSISPSEKHNAGFLYEALMDCFEEVVKRSTKAALARHLETRHTAPSRDLRQEDSLFTPAERSAE